jgi:general secretion pathway protein B
MSFILDALKKSESERQQQGSAEFSSVPTSSGNTSPARWLWMLAALLAVNFAVLIGILMRPDTTSDAAPVSTPVANAELTSAQVAAPNFEDQIADAIEDRPEPLPAAEPMVTTAAPAPRHTTIASVPTIDQLRLDGSLQIAELHLDIHVFSEVPTDRFVFINMVKHREGSRTDEGPVVREIRADGVILEYQGRVFLLPRE